jgi:chemotaxis receptor (MCP) glutamine deamidase CheD/CheY-specific phosphatase CheX
MCAQRIIVNPSFSYVTNKEDVEIACENVGSGVCLIMRDPVSKTTGVAHVILPDSKLNTLVQTNNLFVYGDTAPKGLLDKVQNFAKTLPGSPVINANQISTYLIGAAETMDSKTDIRLMAVPALTAVLNTQLRFTATEFPKTEVIPQGGPCIQAHINFTGERIDGEVIIQFTPELVAIAGRRLMGMEDGAELSEADMGDIVGELCNMIAGRVTNNFAQEGMSNKLSTPRTFNGPRKLLEPDENFEYSQTEWSCEKQHLTLLVRKTRAQLNLGPKIRNAIRTSVRTRGVTVKSEIYGGQSQRTVIVSVATGTITLKENGHPDKKI